MIRSYVFEFDDIPKNYITHEERIYQIHNHDDIEIKEKNE